MDRPYSAADSDNDKAEILAAALGVEVGDVLRWVIRDTQEFDGNGKLIGYLVEFAEGTPPEVLARVSGRSGRRVHVGTPMAWP